MARYKTNGTLDSTFGTNGSVIQPLSLTPYSAYGKAVAIQNDGKIIVGGGTFIVGSGLDLTLLRYNTNGTLDTSFSGDGIAMIDFAAGNDICYSLVIQADGKIVASGVATLAGNNQDFALLRFNTNGSLDSTFDSDGIVTTQIGTNYDIGFSVALNSQNKIVVGGNADSYFALAQYNTNGSLDNTFSGDGIQFTLIGVYFEGRSLVVQNNDKIVLAGYSNSPTSEDFALARYNTNGMLDASFGTGGIVTSDFAGDDDVSFSLALQTDGKIVAFGNSHPYPSTTDFAIARYIGDCAASAFSQTLAINSGDSVTVGNNTYYTLGTYIDTLTAASGCDSIVTTNLTVLTALTENLLLDNTLTIYPNPFTAQTTITFSETQKNTTIKITDLLGKEIKTINFTGKQLVLEKENMKAGIYFVQTTDIQKHICNKKIVIQ